MKILLLLLLLASPSLRVYSSPRVALAIPGGGALVTIHARIEGEVNEEWYCPTVTFIFPDDTKMKRGRDCVPFEEREDDGDISWEAMRNFPPGDWSVEVTLSKNDKVFVRDFTMVRVR